MLSVHVQDCVKIGKTEEEKIEAGEYKAGDPVMTMSCTTSNTVTYNGQTIVISRPVVSFTPNCAFTCQHTPRPHSQPRTDHCFRFSFWGAPPVYNLPPRSGGSDDGGFGSGAAVSAACSEFMDAAYQCEGWSTERVLELAPEPILELTPAPDIELVAAPSVASPEAIEGFLGALTAEYVDGVDCGVGNWLDSGADANGINVDLYETRVRGAEDPAAEIESIRAELLP